MKTVLTYLSDWKNVAILVYFLDVFDVFFGLLLHDLMHHHSLHDLDDILPCIRMIDSQIW